MLRFLFGTWKGRFLVVLLAGAGAAWWGIRRFLGIGQDFEEWSPPAPEAGAPTSEGTGSTDVAPSLLEILACPEDKKPVIKQGDKIVCTHCGKRYPVRDGIPVMLIDEAEPGPVPTEEEVAAARVALKDGTEATADEAGGSGPEASETGEATSQDAEGTSTEGASTEEERPS